MAKNKIIVIGTGFFSDEVTDLLSMDGRYEVLAYIEGIDREKCLEQKFGKPIIWIDDIDSLDRSHQCICAIGSPKRKGIISRFCENGFSFITLIHSSAQVFPSAVVGEGSIVGAGSVIAARATVGKQVIINRGCLIGHHSRIDDYVTTSPGVNIAGKVTVGEGTSIGMGAIVHDGIHIGKKSVIGSGSLITRDVPDSVQVMGTPARITKELNN